jgi:hypothetical protein
MGRASVDRQEPGRPVNGWTGRQLAGLFRREIGVATITVRIHDGDYRFASMPDYFTDDPDAVVADVVGCQVERVAPAARRGVSETA